MYKEKVIITNKTGLHARPATIVSEKALNFDSDVFIEKGSIKCDAKEVLDLMSLDINLGDEISVISDDKDAVDELIETIKNIEE